MADVPLFCRWSIGAFLMLAQKNYMVIFYNILEMGETKTIWGKHYNINIGRLSATHPRELPHHQYTHLRSHCELLAAPQLQVFSQPGPFILPSFYSSSFPIPHPGQVLPVYKQDGRVSILTCFLPWHWSPVLAPFLCSPWWQLSEEGWLGS